MTLPRATVLVALLAALAAPTTARAGSALVEIRQGGEPLVQAAGGRSLAPELGLWRVPRAALPSLRRAGILVRTERERSYVRLGALAVGAEPLQSFEWWRSIVGADTVAPPGPGKPVTIVDSGLDVTHEEFQSRPNTTVLNRQTLETADEDHGTEVASVVAAPVNGLGLVGVYPQAVLRSWDASPFAFITSGSAVQGIIAATREGPGVINLSFGGDDPDPVLEQAIVYAFRHGSLVVSSAGNEGLDGNPLSYPASYPHVLTVAATGQSGTVASFSSESPYVDLAAPGVDIPVAEPIADDPTGYISASGTSFSAPMVSGAAAWVWTTRPSLDNTQLFDVLRMSAHDIAPAGYDRATGFGMLDIPAALTFTPPLPDPGEPNDAIDEVSPNGLFTGGEPAITTAGHLSATAFARVDRNEDPHDVYRAFVPPHGTLTAQTSGGTVDLRVYRSSAQSLSRKPFAASTRAGVLPDEVRFKNGFSRGVFVYVEVRPDPQTMRTSYTLRVTSAARR